MENSLVERQIENALIERQMENALQKVFHKAVRIAKGVSRMTGGELSFQNFQLPSKRTLVVAGVSIIAVQVAASAIGTMISRRREDQRIERIARRVVEEERLKNEAKA